MRSHEEEHAIGPLAQLVAHLHDAQGVTGSSPVRPTGRTSSYAVIPPRDRFAEFSSARVCAATCAQVSMVPDAGSPQLKGLVERLRVVSVDRQPFADFCERHRPGFSVGDHQTARGSKSPRSGQRHSSCLTPSRGAEVNGIRTPANSELLLNFWQIRQELSPFADRIFNGCSPRNHGQIRQPGQTHIAASCFTCDASQVTMASKPASAATRYTIEIWDVCFGEVWLKGA